MSKRVIKHPEERRQEILDTAMVLFRQKGYDATSIADIARAMNVVPGLCYRYFPSKKEIFDEAVRQYAIESSQEFLEVIRDTGSPFKERVDRFGHLMLSKEDRSPHHDFYHAPGNETFHIQLSIEMLGYIAPYLNRELARLSEAVEIYVEDPELMAEFLLYGQIALWQPSTQGVADRPLEEKLRRFKGYIYKLLNVE